MSATAACLSARAMGLLPDWETTASNTRETRTPRARVLRALIGRMSVLCHLRGPSASRGAFGRAADAARQPAVSGFETKDYGVGRSAPNRGRNAPKCN